MKTNQTPANNRSLAIVRSKRRQLRALGVTAAELHGLEVYLALRNTNPRTTQADLANVMGYTRTHAARILRRLCDRGLLVKIGRTFVAMIDAFLRIEKQAVISRRLWYKLRELKKKSRLVTSPVVHKGKDISNLSNEVVDINETPAEALAALRAMRLASSTTVEQRRKRAGTA